MKSNYEKSKTYGDFNVRNSMALANETNQFQELGSSQKENYSIGKTPIQVIIRTRPFLFEERKVSTYETINILDRESLMIRNKDEKIDIMTLTKEKLFRYDHIFDSLQNMIKISNFALTEKYLPEIFKGRNLTFLLYGGELSGKTHSLIGNIYDPGVLSVFLDAIFDHMDEFHYKDRTKIYMSFVEADDEKFKDLLTNLSTSLDIWKEIGGSCSLIGLTRTKVENICEVQRALKVALKNSSGRDFQIENFAKLKTNFLKTHFIVEVNIEFHPDEYSDKRIRSKLLFVDFAGIEHNNWSEKFDKVQNSLISLSNCFRTTSEICTHLRKVKYVPYDSSKLTMLLKEALGGNSKTIFIGTLCPHVLYMESMSSLLRQATQVKNIHTNVKENITNAKILHMTMKDTSVIMKRSMKMLSASLLSGDFEKKSRQKVLAFSRLLLMDLKSLLINFINQYSLIISKEEKYQSECSTIIKMQIKGFSTMLNSNDLKQFFMAKLPLYLKVNIDKQMELLSPRLNELLSELKQEYNVLKKIKTRMRILRKKIVPGNPYQITGNDLSYFYDFLQGLKALMKYFPVFKLCKSFMTIEYLNLVEDVYSEFNIPLTEDIQEGDLLVDITKDDKMVVNLISNMKFTVESPRKNSPLGRANTVYNQGNNPFETNAAAEPKNDYQGQRSSIVPIKIQQNDETGSLKAGEERRSSGLRKSFSSFEFQANMAYSRIKGASIDLEDPIEEETIDDEEKRRQRYLMSFMEFQRNEKNSSKLSGTTLLKKSSPYRVFEGSVGQSGFYKVLEKSRRNNSVKRRKIMSKPSENRQPEDGGATFQSFNFIGNKEGAKLSFIGGGNDAFEDSLLEEILNNKAMKFLEKEQRAAITPLTRFMKPVQIPEKGSISLPKITSKKINNSEDYEDGGRKNELRDILKLKLTKEGILEGAMKLKLRNYGQAKKTNQKFFQKFIVSE